MELPAAEQALQEAGFSAQAARFAALVVLSGGVFVREFASRWIGDDDVRRARTERFNRRRGVRRLAPRVRPRQGSGQPAHALRGRLPLQRQGALPRPRRGEQPLPPSPRPGGLAADRRAGSQGVGRSGVAALAVAVLDRGAGCAGRLAGGAPLGAPPAFLRHCAEAGGAFPGPAAHRLRGRPAGARAAARRRRLGRPRGGAPHVVAQLPPVHRGGGRRRGLGLAQAGPLGGAAGRPRGGSALRAVAGGRRRRRGGARHLVHAPGGAPSRGRPPAGRRRLRRPPIGSPRASASSRSGSQGAARPLRRASRTPRCGRRKGSRRHGSQAARRGRGHGVVGVGPSARARRPLSPVHPAADARLVLGRWWFGRRCRPASWSSCSGPWPSPSGGCGSSATGRAARAPPGSRRGRSRRTTPSPRSSSARSIIRTGSGRSASPDGS